MTHPIHFNNQQFQSKILYSRKYGEILIASEKLNPILSSLEGDYINKEAQTIDEQIFYFVPEHYFNFSEKDLIQKIETEVI